MVKILPSVLSADFAHLEQDCCRVMLPDSRYIHFDVMDGHFVPNLSIGMPVLKSLARAMPDVYYDVHLMLSQPGRYIQAFADAGATGITIHCEAEQPTQTLKDICNLGLKAGVSLRPGTPVEALFPLLEQVGLVLVMSVEPGFGGQAFMPQSVQRIAALKDEIDRRGLDIIIEVDGGINLETGPQVVKAGATWLVAGSSVFGAADPPGVMRQLAGDAT